jgi:NADPH:quinone reductase-like Zn-dependent oxidoreductase
MRGGRMRNRSVVVTKRGGPEVLQVVEKELRKPLAGEVRVKNLAVPVCLPDVEARYGRSPFKLKTPYVPGYAVVGDVEATGEGVTTAAVGDRIAALTVYGGYCEFIILGEDQLVPVPVGLNPAQVAPLILNYIVAYQTLHRSAKVKPGDKVLIIGASGGIGTAFLQLGKLAGLTMYGVASKSKHQILIEYGATPIDYHTQNIVAAVQGAEPEVLDAVFDGIGGDYIKQGFSLLRRGGTYVGYSNPLSLASMFRYLGQVLLFNYLPNGKSAKFYGTGSSRLNRRPYMEDWAVLFELLGQGKIKPIIAAKYPILEADKANELLESGKVTGNIVLLAPELLAVK